MLVSMRRCASLTAFFSSVVLAQADPHACAACHGADGNSSTAAVPSIAAQPKVFIETQLILFREGVRVSEPMQKVAKGMKDADISRLAEHFSKLPARSVVTTPDDGNLAKRGLALAQKLRCANCHAQKFQGQAQIPRLAAQREDWLESEMRAYRDNKRSGGDTIMAATLYGVSDADIKALAHYLSRLR
jgi:cytochrome c553